MNNNKKISRGILSKQKIEIKFNFGFFNRLLLLLLSDAAVAYSHTIRY